ncbi:hypothetical protein FGO68_gene10301 [Halteria grandinella]|uniref:Queuosine 5'-phosphate N-glycosylase/hydrolase n=1 Tax=Halteria grandinella TaxID=5974 RepID=A0A8J8NFB7_HALGN|nr:hypothetical protein FGO68_gene10301 [Halteria grandinella]
MESSQALPESLNTCSLVRKTCQRVYSQMLKKEVPNIKLNESKIHDFIHHLSDKVSKDGVAFEPWAKYHIDPNAYPLEAVLSYTFVVDAMNFCFWPGNPAGNFEYEHMTKNLAKILHSNPECFSAEMLSAMTPEWLKQFVFNNLEFALLEERARIVREVGIVIHTFYKGSFVKYLSNVNWDAVKLVRQIAMDFTGFRDEAIYNGEQIFFYKRAQILVADLYGALSERTNPKDGQQTEPFKNLEQLTMFADYRVPQTLRLVGIMEYSPVLSAKIDPFDTVSHDNELPYSSVEEVEIRAATVVAVQMIMDEISKEGTPQALKEQVKYAFQVDWLLWQMGESRLSELLPHHKVHSIFY